MEYRTASLVSPASTFALGAALILFLHDSSGTVSATLPPSDMAVSIQALPQAQNRVDVVQPTLRTIDDRVARSANTQQRWVF